MCGRSGSKESNSRQTKGRVLALLDQVATANRQTATVFKGHVYPTVKYNQLPSLISQSKWASSSNQQEIAGDIGFQAQVLITWWTFPLTGHFGLSVKTWPCPVLACLTLDWASGCRKPTLEHSTTCAAVRNPTNLG